MSLFARFDHPRKDSYQLAKSIEIMVISNIKKKKKNSRTFSCNDLQNLMMRMTRRRMMSRGLMMMQRMIPADPTGGRSSLHTAFLYSTQHTCTDRICLPPASTYVS